MNEVVHVLLGAALVAIGILAAALSDRIRGVRITRERASVVSATRTSRAAPDSDAMPIPRLARARVLLAESKTQQAVARDVVAALVAAGYTKQVVTEAVWGCNSAERSTIEEWTRAALRRCARGATS